MTKREPVKLNRAQMYDIIRSPVITEKSTIGGEHGQVTFRVPLEATKPEIKAAVELLFKVEVESVQTVVQKGKVKKFGRSIGRRDHVKKAYVSLKAGQELNFTGEAA